MYELVDYLVKQLVPENTYEIIIVEDGNNVDMRVQVDSEYVAQLIGKSGKIAKAIRTIVRAASGKSEKIYSVYVEER